MEPTGACARLRESSERFTVNDQRGDGLHASSLLCAPRQVRQATLWVTALLALGICLLSCGTLVAGNPIENPASEYVARPFYEAGHGAGPAPSKVTDRILKVIVLDPGHGGDDVGAVGPTGLEERDVALEVALRFRALLEQGLGCQVILTRETNESVPLTSRTGVANHHKADLFFSIHTNAHFGGVLEGFTSYIFRPGKNGRVAPAAADRIRRVGEVSHGGISWNSVQIPHLARSTLLATLIQTNIAQSGLARDRGISERPSLLLAGADMPAVLVEIGFITNYEEELKLKSGAYLERIAEVLFQSTKDYFEVQRWYAE